MTFLLDENFPRAASGFLKGLGHTVIDARDRGLAGANDSQLLATASQLGAVMPTTDRDFFHTLHHEHPGHGGVVVIALRQPNRKSILDRLSWFLNAVAGRSLTGRAFQLRDSTWLIHPPFEPGNSTEEDSAGATFS